MRQFAAIGLWIVALGLALWLGFAALRSDDMGILAGLLFLFAAGCSFAQPQRPWRWGLFWGLSIPVTTLLFSALYPNLHYAIPWKAIWPDLLPTFVALLPAFLGAYAGAGLRRLFSVPRPDDPPAPNSPC